MRDVSSASLALAHSSRGPGRRPLTAVTRVRIPYALPSFSPIRSSPCHDPPRKRSRTFTAVARPSRYNGGVMVNVDRRTLLAQLMVAAAGVPLALAETRLTATPSQTAGPFYPEEKPLDRDADLTQIRGHR